ncbi:MAG: helix-turn-helix domain-containing protein [Phycisphaerales bacterium JB054]
MAEPRQREICRRVVEAALQSGVFGGLELPVDAAGHKPPLDVFLTAVLEGWLRMWDAVYYQGAQGWPHLAFELGGFVLGRQAVIDLAVRTSALLQLSGSSDPASMLALAADEHPGRAVIESLMKRSGCEVTRMTLASKVGVEKSTVDDWIDKDTVPRHENIVRLAHYFATDEMDAPSVQRWLRIQYGLLGLRTRLASGLGERWGRELVVVWACFTQWTLALHGESSLDRADFLTSQVYALSEGTRSEPCYWVLNRWLKLMEDPLWLDDIMVAQHKGAADRLQECFETIGDWPSAIERMYQSPEFLDLPEEERELRAIVITLIWMSPRAFADGISEEHADQAPSGRRIEWLAAVARSHMARNDFTRARKMWPEIIAQEPDCAEHHCHFGVCLWNARPNPDHNRAIEELARAHSLRPTWDYPVAEIARVFMGRGWFGHASQHLLDAPRELVEGSQDCCFTLSNALALDHQYSEALRYALLACDLDASHAEAWDVAAQCAFEIGDRKQGARCAREALRLGQSRSFDKWMR